MTEASFVKGVSFLKASRSNKQKFLLSGTMLGISFLITLALVAVILLIFLPFRWVIRGFKTPPKSGVTTKQSIKCSIL
jgi:hypothetical protein